MSEKPILSTSKRFLNRNVLGDGRQLSVSNKLTAAEHGALLRVSRTLGKRWKSIVRAAWARGKYKATGVNSDDYWALQSVRNKLSPIQFAKLQRIEV